MPEGPEIWMLSKAINLYYATANKTTSVGKHLFLLDTKENWSFGLTGKVCIKENGTGTGDLCKRNLGAIYGHQVCYEDLHAETSKLGLDFMTAEKEELQTEISKWTTSKKLLAGLLLDQTRIAGIGVAWGSEILYKAQLRPDKKACEQNLTALVDSMITVRDEIKVVYETCLQEPSSMKEFINQWFTNLYELRQMNVYKKGTKVQVLGRSWYC